jgi:ABC-type multidrug transport system fused ATPase/permease subunit
LTAAATPAAPPEALETPYWRIDAGGERGYSGRALLRRFAKAAAPVARIVRTAAPRSAAIVVGAQIVAAVAIGISLILAGSILQSLFAEGAGIARARAALPALVALGLLLLLRIAAEAASGVARAHLGPKARREAEQALLRATLHIELASYDDPSFYDQLQRARDRGILHLEGAIASLVATGAALLSVAAAAVALFVLHPVLPLLLLVAMAPEAWGALAAARIQYAGIAATVALTRQSEMMSELATGRPSAPEVRANQAQAYILAEHLAAATALQHHLVGLGIAEAKALAAGRLLSALGLAATFVALFAMMQAGWVDLAVAGAAVIAIRTAGASLSGLVLAGHELLEKALYISDYRDFLDQAALRTRPARGGRAPARPGAIVVDDVSFAYPGNPQSPAIRGLSLRIEAGETVALVGENGSGKTTLAKLIAGLFRPDFGAIRWGAADLRDIDPESLAEQVAMVLQEPIKWPRSARDNVRIGRFERPDPDGAHLMEAARQSRAGEVIERLPGGWDTLLSRQFRGGRDLSAGQWQRLAVARGLYRDAPLVIWDEPTAPLDAKAEHAVYESLRRLARDRTVILITHRLASVRNANRIFFLDAGRVAEQGTHDELLALGGRYFELYELQRKLSG